ncbi:hypothetical protein GGI25_001163 [Coemansia spiralis]|uniref:DUF4112 domain-containing protein n=2 Tax=Coemansia TaxID=4863 RepID=A0A9W8G6B2_9FUNG|nr:hypothetical protein EDC05_000834 [Coemansia umbellata]KAJ2625072.1 hypothetical protein GGI26_000875 [Coemansia sp. RSA 1358]KAJ2679974.1 hypothetical protein GGI25_001163 [Coemansia spiralis]
MSNPPAKQPDKFTTQEKKQTLYPLYRRARHLDRKWAIGRGIPDDSFTYLAILPYVGDIMSTTLAIGYFKKIRGTFRLSEEAQKEMVGNIAKNAIMSVIPYLGWILRRIYHVNRRNYLVLEKYVMGAATISKEGSVATSKSSTQRNSSIDRNSTANNSRSS